MEFHKIIPHGRLSYKTVSRRRLSYKTVSYKKVSYRMLSHKEGAYGRVSIGGWSTGRWMPFQPNCPRKLALNRTGELITAVEDCPPVPGPPAGLRLSLNETLTGGSKESN